MASIGDVLNKLERMDEKNDLAHEAITEKVHKVELDVTRLKERWRSAWKVWVIIGGMVAIAGGIIGWVT